MRLKKGLVAGLVAGIVMMVIGVITAGMSKGWYQATPQCWIVSVIPIDIRSVFSPTSLWLTCFGGFVGILFGLVYSVVQAGIPGTGIKKGLIYGFLLYLIGGLPGVIINCFSIKTPAVFGLITARGWLLLIHLTLVLIYDLLMGIIIAIVYEKVSKILTRA
ncbi:MAG: hypothetical protein AB1397_08445 [bacterium]